MYKMRQKYRWALTTLCPFAPFPLPHKKHKKHAQGPSDKRCITTVLKCRQFINYLNLNARHLVNSIYYVPIEINI